MFLFTDGPTEKTVGGMDGRMDGRTDGRVPRDAVVVKDAVCDACTCTCIYVHPRIGMLWFV